MFGLGAGELFLIFIIALLFLGPKKLPELAKGLGQAMREFQKARDHVVTEMNKPHGDTKSDVEVLVTKREEEKMGENKTTNESPKQQS